MIELEKWKKKINHIVMKYIHLSNNYQCPTRGNEISCRILWSFTQTNILFVGIMGFEK